MIITASKKRKFLQGRPDFRRCRHRLCQTVCDLAKEMAAKETNPKRKKELEHIAEVCPSTGKSRQQLAGSPASGVDDPCRAVLRTGQPGALFRTFDQYMYPFYKKSVIDEKTMTRDHALELLECFWIKCNGAMLRSYEFVKVLTGMGLGLVLTMGGQTRDGKDACNEVTMLCLETDEQLGVLLPETAFRMWKAPRISISAKLPNWYVGIRQAGSSSWTKKGVQMVAKGYPELTIEDWREYSCWVAQKRIYRISQWATYTSLTASWLKILELVINNGKCAICGKQIGPLTGDPRTFESIERLRQAFREQVFYWMTYNAKGSKELKQAQSAWYPAPFSSSCLKDAAARH